jgi:DNA-binding beta-propeller fold protein YncE
MRIVPANRVTATIPVGGDPSGVAVDPLTATGYVANEIGDTLSAITN